MEAAENRDPNRSSSSSYRGGGGGNHLHKKNEEKAQTKPAPSLPPPPAPLAASKEKHGEEEEEEEEEKDEPQSSESLEFRKYFTHVGAALVLQRWYRGWRSHRKAVWRRKHSKLWRRLRQNRWLIDRLAVSGPGHRQWAEGYRGLSFGDRTKWLAALILQRFVRMAVQRRRYLHQQQLRASQEMRVYAAARLLQRVYRGYRTRRQLGESPSGRVPRRMFVIRPRSRPQAVAVAGTGAARMAARRRLEAQGFGWVEDLERKRTMVQRVVNAWRRYRRRKQRRQALSQLVRPVIMDAVSAPIRITRWFRAWCFRRLRRRAACVLQRFVRGFLARCHYFKRRSAIIKLQYAWRRYLRQRLHRKKHIQVYYVYVLQRFARWVLARLRVNSLRTHRRRCREFALSGTQLVDQLMRSKHVAQMWEGITVIPRAASGGATHVDHELQRYFAAGCSQPGFIELSTVLKLFKPLPQLLDGRAFTSNTIELQFVKVKDPAQKRLDYAHFLDLLHLLAAIKFLNIDPSNLSSNVLEIISSSSSSSNNHNHNHNHNHNNNNNHPGAATAAPGAGTVAGAAGGGRRRSSVSRRQSVQDVALRAMENFRFGPLRGRSALITKFVFQFIRKSKEFREVENRLQGQSAWRTLQSRFEVGAIRIQRFVRNRFLLQRLTAQLHAHQTLKRENLRNAAAIKIQHLVRVFINHRFVVHLAQVLYSKFLDSSTQQFYWFNPRTNRYFWEKPKLLGSLDCGIPIRLPPTEEQYVIMCAECQRQPATGFCDECDRSMCVSCFALCHHPDSPQAQYRAHYQSQYKFPDPSFRSHTFIDLKNCVHCQFQAGTKVCLSCRDVFCDSCFAYNHRKGRARLHVYRWQTESCMICDDRAARWVFTDPFNAYHKTLYCLTCYTTEFGIAPEIGDCLEPYNYQPQAVRDFRQAKEAALAKANKAYRREQVERKIAEYKRLSSTFMIQRVWRGHRVRLALKPFIAARKEYFALRVVEDKKYRATALYKALRYFGLAPRLSTDTIRERLLNLYPVYRQDLLHSAIGGRWKEAFAMIREEDELKHVLHNPVADAINVTKLKSNEEALIGIRQDLVEIRKKIQNVQIIINQLPDEQQLPHKITKAKYEESETRMKNEETRLLGQIEGLNAKLTHYSKNHQVRRLVKNVVEKGLELPFTVNLVQDSNFAVVRWKKRNKSSNNNKNNNNSNNNKAANDKFGGLGLDEDEDEDEDNNEDNRDQRRSKVPRRKRDWRDYLQPHDFVLIRGAIYEVQSSQVFHEALQQSQRDSVLLQPELQAQLQLEQFYYDEAASLDRSGIASEIENPLERLFGKHNYQALNVDDSTEAYLEVHREIIVLDRVWTLEDQTEVPVFKLAPMLFSERGLLRARRALLFSSVGQAGLLSLTLGIDQFISLHQTISNLFDDESETYYKLQSRMKRLEVQRNFWVLRSRTVIDFKQHKESRQKRMEGFRKFLRRSCMYLTTWFIPKSCRKSNEEKVDRSSPFYNWNKSAEKTEINLVFEEDETTNKLVELGKISMDVHAPCSVLREYVQRGFRNELNNSLKIGDAFVFFVVADGEMKRLARELEASEMTKRWTQYKLNAKTMEGSNTVVIVRDKQIQLPEGEIMTIPEFPDEAQINIRADIKFKAEQDIWEFG